MTRIRAILAALAVTASLAAAAPAVSAPQPADEPSVRSSWSGPQHASAQQPNHSSWS